MTIADVKLAYTWLANSTTQAKKLSKEELDSRRLFRRECNTWLKDPNVLGFGIGVKSAGGISTREPALQIFLKQKLRSSRVRDRLVPSILRIPHLHRPFLVDILELNTVHPANTRYMGEGIRQNNWQIGPGSIGCFLRSSIHPIGPLYALTCWHVAGMGKPSGTPVEWCDDAKGCLPNLKFGRLDRSISPGSAIKMGVVRDVALIKIDSDVEVSNISRDGVGLTGIRDPDSLTAGEVLQLSGFKSINRRSGRVIHTKAVLPVKYTGLGNINFKDVIVCDRMSEEGDSGAIALDTQGRGVGMLVGGGQASQSDKNVSVFVPLQAILEALNLRLVTASPSHPTWLTHDAIGSGNGTSASAINVLARTIWGEAEGESTLGKQAVCNVIMNRVASGNTSRYGIGIEGVCNKNWHGVWHFSCWKAGSNRRKQCDAVSSSNALFSVCLDLASKAAQGILEDHTSNSLHYHASSVTPSWTEGRKPILVIGKHLFYNDIP